MPSFGWASLKYTYTSILKSHEKMKNRNEFDRLHGLSFSTCLYPFHIAILAWNNDSKR